MFSVKVTSELEARLDPEFYSPTALETVRRIKARGAWMRLGDAMQEGYRVVYHGVDTIDGLAKSQTAAFLAPTDVDSIGGFSLSQSLRVPQSYITDYPKGVAQPGELLIEVKGNVQKLALVPSVIDEAFLVSGSFFKALLLQRIDSGYVFSFLLGKYGKILKERLCSNSIIDYIARADLESIPFPDLDARAQRFLGDKLRHTERLRENSRQLQLAIDEVLDSVVPTYSTKPQMWSRVSPQILGERFDNQPYRTHFLSLLDSILSIRHETLSQLARVTGGDPVPSEIFGTAGVPLVRIRDIASTGFSNPEVRIPESYALECEGALATEGMIVVGMDGEFRAQFFLREELPQLVNQRVAIINTHGIRPELLTAWLNRTEGQYQLNRWTTLTTVGHIGLDDIRLILVPRLEDTVENALADKALIARRCVWYAHTLAAAAKLLVEGLIEGKVTEAELVTAQVAQERGDDSADRALLRRLTLHGLDVAGQPPLFPDLDALYTLLAQTREEAQ